MCPFVVMGDLIQQGVTQQDTSITAAMLAVGTMAMLVVGTSYVTFRFKRLREKTDALNNPYLPAVFVIAPDLTIASAYNGYWFWGRPTVEELRGDLRRLTREIRPDWEPPR